MEKFIFLRKIHTDRKCNSLEVERIKSIFTLFLKDREKTFFKCILSFKRSSREIKKKNILGMSNRGNLVQGIVLEMFRRAEQTKTRRRRRGQEERKETPGHPALLVSLAGAPSLSQ